MSRALLNGSPRNNLLVALREEAALVRGGRYGAKRGAVNWVRWDWSQNPYGIAVMHDEGYLFWSAAKREGKRGKVTFEMATRFRAAITNQTDGIEDASIDEMLEDAERILTAVEKREDARGNPVLFSAFRASVKFQEFHDIEHLVQGVVVEFEVDY